MKNKKTVSGKMMVVMMSLMLVVGLVTGGTIAWLTSKTEQVKNTFTYGDINITLAETTGDKYTIIPGTNIEKDPKVTVQAGSEACWLFVKVDDSKWPGFKDDNKKVGYAIESGWDALDGEPGVYYRFVDATDAKAGVSYSVLQNDQIIVSNELTKEEASAAKTATLTFQAAAVQYENLTNVSTAYDEVKW
ncbi:SipW-dependent-type signal peptide-containing protein [Floccifex sp.]|uniref:SipW-dependent-type signal peptide-containing protein n=1 Tax=Floccifex sp. TaxID=2815810 RepID=UPI002A7473D8|nr:SipW-dependent-type signal peptide-containing protein [Floccifex sp.]MDD7280766.1 SipW-dependent-type signal peptide-containing protein [Erysipelotrichaceae bacterium]MDY2957627.1 SipW-dependent-type signal peptide-containing protein [Floccifex sp.]